MEKPFTNPLALEWLVKADADFVTAKRESRARQMPNYDAACFHAQQCVEKLLKAMMIQRGVAPLRSHDLGYLLGLILPQMPDWEIFEGISSFCRLLPWNIDTRVKWRQRKWLVRL